MMHAAFPPGACGRTRIPDPAARQYTSLATEVIVYKQYHKTVQGACIGGTPYPLMPDEFNFFTWVNKGDPVL